MNQTEHRDGASAAEDLGDDEDSSHRDGSNETDSESSRRSGRSSSSSVSYDSEESFADDGSSTYSSDGSSSQSSASTSQHSCSSSSGADNSSNSSSSMEEDKNNNDSKMNSPSSLMAAATDSTITTSPSSSAGITTATSTNRTFQRGVLPISINTTGHHGIAVNNNVLTQRRGKKSLESDGEQYIQKDKDDSRHDSKSNNDNRHDRKRRSSKRHRKHKNQQQAQDGAIQCCIKYICCQTKKRSTQILIASFFLWILAQFYYFFYLDLKNYFIGNTKELYDEFFRPQRTGEGDYYQGRGRITNEYFHDYSNKYPGHMTQEEREAAREEARKKIGSVNDDDGFDKDGFRKDTGGRKQNRRSRRKKGSRDSEGSTKVERLKPGCKALEWHSYHFPNCNEIHEIDLQAAVRHPREKYIRQKAKAMSDDEGNNATKSTTTSLSSSFPWGFVSNGLWRDVFSCDPRGEVSGSIEAESFPMPPAVLKIMKREHPYDQRNFQRHRRDALVMERLSSSHHLVPIYGYCANTVLTQAISHTLDEVIYAREYETTKKWNPRNGYESKPSLESWMGKDENGELLATRETELGRIHLALGVFRGLVDLHEGDGKTDTEWLPVIHADLQAKQYLVDSNTGKVYLNDFNRCRFIAKKDNNQSAAGATSNGTLLAASNVTNGTATSHPIQTTCPVYIPTAPGYSRSPEEYNNGALTEKLDVYSAGNILYGIITGKKPWNGERGSHIRKGIAVGKRPEIDPAIRDAEGTVDAELVRLLDRVYEGDPDERASAKEVVVALEELLEKVNEGK